MTEVDWLASDDPAAMLRYMEKPECSNPQGHISGTDCSHDSRISDRRLRLFACALCRQVWHLLVDDASCWSCGGSGKVGRIGVEIVGPGRSRPLSQSICLKCCGTGRVNRSRRAVEVAERYADGEATATELEFAEYSSRAAYESFGLTSQSGVFRLANSCCVPNIEPAVQQIVRKGCVGVPAQATQAALLRDIVGSPFRPVPALAGEICPKCSGEGCSGHGELVPWVCRDGWKQRPSPWLTPTVLSIARTIYDERRFEDTGVLRDALMDAGCNNDTLLDHCFEPLHCRGCFLIDLILGKD